MFSVRIVTADYYLASPVKDLDVCYSEFRENDVKKVPVVRIFGATPAGKKKTTVVFICVFLQQHARCVCVCAVLFGGDGGMTGRRSGC